MSPARQNSCTADSRLHSPNQNKLLTCQGRENNREEPAVWGLEPGAWDLGPVAWGLGPGAWGLGPGAWGLGPGTWSLGPGVLCLVSVTIRYKAFQQTQGGPYNSRSQNINFHPKTVPHKFPNVRNFSIPKTLRHAVRSGYEPGSKQ